MLNYICNMELYSLKVISRRKIKCLRVAITRLSRVIRCEYNLNDMPLLQRPSCAVTCNLCFRPSVTPETLTYDPIRLTI